MVQMRSPSHKINHYGSTPVPSTEAYTGTSRSRVGHYNDCFVSSADDFGTYLSTSEWTFVANESKYLVMGGETCALDTRNDCTNATAEMASLHWQMLHQGYHPDVITKWQTQGCFSTIQSKLGYRFQLQNATLPTTAKCGGSIRVTFTLENTGYGSPYNPRNLEFLLRNTSTGAITRYSMSNDPRTWYPGSTISVTGTFTLPTNIPTGNYTMMLNLPDPVTGLSTNPNYSIQLANTGTWESTTGFNSLNTTLVISN